jgi:hypothetical protein
LPFSCSANELGFSQQLLVLWHQASSLSARGFISVSFHHVKRSSNEAAHFLAQSCVTANSSFVFRSVPDCGYLINKAPFSIKKTIFVFT